MSHTESRTPEYQLSEGVLTGTTGCGLGLFKTGGDTGVGSGGTALGEGTLGVGVTVRFIERTVFPTELAGGGVTFGAIFVGVDCGILCGVFGVLFTVESGAGFEAVLPGTGGRSASNF